MSEIASICIYCGSSSRASEAHLDAAARLGRLIAESGRTIIYGGGRLGLMGRIAQGGLAGGGTVVGIIPEHLYKVEVQNEDVTELLVVDTMHTRKAEMVRRADAFCVLPGGIGTLDELVEILTWRQLELHDKPVVVVNQDGYFEPFRALLAHFIEHRYAGPALLGFVSFVDRVEDVLPLLEASPAERFEEHPEKI
ncbi:TIGR00730 family Rossman fold protein [Minwuia thermotolerans]|uniref:Cytokinin riboside 5'-monophosphate phosphoribohydrolase n=1 Tax=Minwuia thermotolerans TaxID=2056226 RepID=A0A2M9FY80_9PROT|nr:TIGR00730 family Rossman fold protein [Minwuia thermotolerans]PJK28414.1 TIGR00730 family Rossman fold protein [Minwuia thermotolerans]